MVKSKENKNKRSSIPWPTTKPNRMMNQRKAWQKGKRVVLTIPNPNLNETNKRYIKVLANELWGDYRKQKGYMMKGE